MCAGDLSFCVALSVHEYVVCLINSAANESRRLNLHCSFIQNDSLLSLGFLEVGNLCLLNHTHLSLDDIAVDNNLAPSVIQVHIKQ